MTGDFLCHLYVKKNIHFLINSFFIKKSSYRYFTPPPREENLWLARENSNLLSDKPGIFGKLTDSAFIQIAQSQCLHILDPNGRQSRLSINFECDSLKW